MSINLQAADIRHERRIRLVFTNALAGGAFGAPAPVYYTVTSLDGRGLAPNVQAALVVPGSATVVELALDVDLVRDGLYQIAAIGVPAVDTTVTSGASVLPIRFGRSFRPVNAEPLRLDKARLLYGSDLLWNGVDFQETPTGDLARISGTANVTKALYHAIECNGLPWDPGWGASARDFVDSPSAAAGTLRGAVAAQVLLDPRVKTIRTDIEIGDAKTFLYLTPTLITNETLERVSIAVPNVA